MSWAKGQNRAGREIGYAVFGRCDYPNCTVEIDRGMENACGGMHESTSTSCDRYFCRRHRGPAGRCPDCTRKFTCPSCGHVTPTGALCTRCSLDARP
jgi:hypothetical protein